MIRSFVAARRLRAVHPPGRAVRHGDAGRQRRADELLPRRRLFPRRFRHRRRTARRPRHRRARRHAPSRQAVRLTLFWGFGLAGAATSCPAVGRRRPGRADHHRRGRPRRAPIALSALGGVHRAERRAGVPDGRRLHRRDLVARHAQHDAAVFPCLQRRAARRWRRPSAITACGRRCMSSCWCAASACCRACGCRRDAGALPPDARCQLERLRPPSDRGRCRAARACLRAFPSRQNRTMPATMRPGSDGPA